MVILPLQTNERGLPHVNIRLIPSAQFSIYLLLIILTLDVIWSEILTSLLNNP
jgi:hypothetical protein